MARADLRGANLAWADLSGTDLCFADLRGACLDGAVVVGTKFRGAKLDSDARLVIKKAQGRWPRPARR